MVPSFLHSTSIFCGGIAQIEHIEPVKGQFSKQMLCFHLCAEPGFTRAGSGIRCDGLFRSLVTLFAPGCAKRRWDSNCR